MNCNFSSEYDVVVTGGGIAGVAAALAAARSGRKTALIEKTVLLGGLATTGLVYIYLPLCDGNGTQVTFGICEELIKLSIKYGPGDIPPDWCSGRNAAEVKRYRCVFSPAAFMLALDEVLEEAGVDIWLDTLVCGAETGSDARLSGIYVENKSGRGMIKAKCFVDASGDAEVARRAGAPYFTGDNYLSMWALQYDARGKSHPLSDKVQMFVDGCTPDGRSGMRKRCGLDGREVSSFVLEARKLLREHYQREYASGNADRNSLFPLKLPAMAQFRKIAGIKGLKTLADDQYATFFEDSIGMVADWRKPGYVWEVPYGTLLPQKVKWLLAAGRCVSSIGDAWEIMRVIPSAALTGEAAGTAAALAIEHDVPPDELDVKIVQRQLVKNGFPLHLQDVGL